MDKVIYYSDSPYVRSHNSKTQQLAEILKRYRNTLFEFTTDFTDDTLLTYFKSIAVGLNQNFRRGAEILVYKTKVEERIIYSFKEPSREAVGRVLLIRATNHIDCEEDL